MGRAPCCEKVGLKRGRWTVEEDEILMKYIENNGEGSWRSLPKNAGLLRCGKSCRLRWLNYLKTDLKRGNISPEEDTLIIKLHNTLGNRWSIIAGHLPGRTDNEIKNYWNSHLSRRIDSFRRPNNGHETLPPILMNLSKINGGYKIKRHGRISRATMKKNNHHSNVVKKSDSYVSMPTSQEETTTTLVASISLKQNDEIIQTMSMVSPYLERGSVVLCSSSEEREGPTPTSVNNNQERERERLGPNQGLETEKLTMCSNDTMDSWLMSFDEERECVGFDSNPKTTSEEERGEMSITNATTIRDDLSQISDWYFNSDSNAITLCFEDQRWVDWDWVDRVEGHTLWADCEQMLSW